MSYQVKLEVFEGPFDLLLHLIARRQVDVTEIDLADITRDFLELLGDGLETLDLETATRFLIVAATLVELKAARLLPAEERDELEDLLDEARDLLYARLLEYRAYRDVSRVLAHRLTQHEWYLPREVPLEAWLQRLVPETPLQVDATGLAALAAAVTAPSPDRPVDLSHIRRSYLSIREAAEQILDALPVPGVTTAFRALAGDRDRGDRVVLFLALLELFKLGRVDLEQPDHRGSLAIVRREGGIDLADLDDLDEPDEQAGPDDERAEPDDERAEPDEERAEPDTDRADAALVQETP
jgi:segregation and condensation protein A